MSWFVGGLCARFQGEDRVMRAATLRPPPATRLGQTPTAASERGGRMMGRTSREEAAPVTTLTAGRANPRGRESRTRRCPKVLNDQ